MLTDGKVLQVQDLLNERIETAGSECSKRCKHWSNHSALIFRCVGKKTHLLSERCLEEVYCERQLVELLARMHEQEDGLSDKPNLEYFLVLLLFDGLWFVALHEYWAHYCDFEMYMLTNRPLTKT